MAVDPDEILTRLLNADIEFIAVTEKRIDSELIKYFTGAPVNIWFNGEDYYKLITPRILNELKRRYKKWNISHQASFDPRDSGGDLRFSAKS